MIAALLISIVANAATAAVYTWRDGNGVPQFSDRPPTVQNEDRTPKVKTIEVPAISTVDTRQLPESLYTPSEKARKEAARKRAQATKSVVMYSAAWCGVCRRAKRYFEAKGIDFAEKDIDQSEANMDEFHKLGGRGVPLIIVDRTKLSGFSPASFEQIYENQ